MAASTGHVGCSVDLLPVIILPKKHHLATLIFLHGVFQTGEKFKCMVDSIWGEEFQFDCIKVIYPTAPKLKYTANRGKLRRLWYDREDKTIESKELTESVDASVFEILKLIDIEVGNGIPFTRIVVGGFSQGGSLSIHVGYRFSRSLAGVFGICSFLNEDSAVYKFLEESVMTLSLPLLLIHGTNDEKMKFAYGKRTHDRLQALGVPATFWPLTNTGHELSKDCLKIVYDWISLLLN